MSPEQLHLITVEAQPGGEDAAVIAHGVTRLLMWMLAPRADPAMEALLKSHEQVLTAAVTDLRQSLKEAMREGVREAVVTLSPSTPPAVTRPPARTAATPRARHRPSRRGAASWDPTVAEPVRAAIDAAAGGQPHREALVMEALEAFRKVMRKGVTHREAIITPFRAQLFEGQVRRCRMTLHIPAQWQRQVTRWADRFEPKLAPNQLLEIILRWRLDEDHEGHGRPGAP